MEGFDIELLSEIYNYLSKLKFMYVKCGNIEKSDMPSRSRATCTQVKLDLLKCY